MGWIIENKEWLFSGIGIIVVGWIFKSRKSKKPLQKIKSGNYSNNIQGGKNVEVSIGDKKNGK